MMVAHYSKVLVSLYTKHLCHSTSLPFQTEKDASHILMTHAFLHNLLFYSSVSNSTLFKISLTIPASSIRLIPKHFYLRPSKTHQHDMLAKLLHLLTGFIGEIQDQISIYIRVRYINRTFAIRFRYLLMNALITFSLIHFHHEDFIIYYIL